MLHCVGSTRTRCCSWQLGLCHALTIPVVKRIWTGYPGCGLVALCCALWHCPAHTPPSPIPHRPLTRSILSVGESGDGSPIVKARGGRRKNRVREVLWTNMLTYEALSRSQDVFVGIHEELSRHMEPRSVGGREHREVYHGRRYPVPSPYLPYTYIGLFTHPPLPIT